jgi:hypothetical protein
MAGAVGGDGLGRRALAEFTARGVDVAAVAVDFDWTQFMARFDRTWPAGSAAAQSYRRRIVDGPDYALDAAPRGDFQCCA